jgi:DNA polymerase elongation subunit (family B)
MTNFYTNVYYDFDSILITERIKDGSKNFRKEPFVPSLFISSNKPTKYKSVQGSPLSEITFDSYSSYKEFKEKYSDVPGFQIHGDINSEYLFINKEYGTDINYDASKIDIMYIDIETSSEKGFPSIENPEEEVIAITVFSSLHGKAVFCLGTFTTQEDIKVFEFQEEETLLKKFIEYFSDNYPDVVSGWNIRFFDFPYLIKRIQVVLGKKQAKMLSPWGILKERFVTRNDREEIAYDLVGISMLDYYELYKTFTYVNQESYSLNHISYVELGEKKLSYSEYESFTEFYKKDFQRFIEYNIRDVYLVQKLEQKLKLIELALALSYSAGVNHQDVFSQVRTWDVIIYNYLSKQNIVVPPKKKGRKDEQYAGAYVKEPLVGKHNWVVSFDLNSLYPHLIMQYNISPETITDEGLRGTVSPDGILKNGLVSMSAIEEYKEKNLSVAANGTTYRKDIRGFLPELMETMYEERKLYKNKMIESKRNLEQVNAELKRRGLTK